MTTYDAPGITDPENVDALTHQQIYDAFQTVGDNCADVVTAWQQARDQWRTSTTGLVQAVRTAVDGHWTGSAAEAAVQAVTGYGTRATDLADLFDQIGQVVANTAQAAQTTKSYIAKPVPVTADQTKDPTEFDTQTRSASKAQDDARQIMQQRYVVPFTTEDARIPTFPPANSTGTSDNPLTALASATTNGVRVSIPGVASIDIPGLGTHPDSTVPAGVHTSLFGTPVTNPGASVTALTDDSAVSRPTANDVLYRPSDRTVLTGDSQVPAATRPASTAPATPASASPHDAPTDTTSRDGAHGTPQHSDSDAPRSEHGSHTTPADNGSQTDGRTSAETHSAANDSAASQTAASQTAANQTPSNQPASNEATANQAASSQAASNQVTANQATSNQPAPTTHADTGSTAAPSAGSSGGAQNATGTAAPGSTDTGAGGPSDSGRGANLTQNSPRLPTTVPGTALPGALAASTAAGSALGAAASIAAPALGAGSMIPNPPSAPNVPPAPTAPAPGSSAPSLGAPAPGSSTPGPDIHSGPIGQGPNSPAPGPNSPAPGTNLPNPGPNTQPPRPIVPTPTGGTPATPPPGSAAATNSIPPVTLTEPAAAAITGAAAAELSDDQHQHHDPRMPRMRVEYEGDRDRLGKTVDLSNESTSAEMGRTEDYVQATIGDYAPRDDQDRAAAEGTLAPTTAETILTPHPVQPTSGDLDNGSPATETARTEDMPPTAAEVFVEPHVEPVIGEYASDYDRGDAAMKVGASGSAADAKHYVQPTIGHRTTESAGGGLDSGASPGNAHVTSATSPTESYVQPTIGDYPPPDDPDREDADPFGESPTAGTTLSGQYVQPTIGD